MNCGYTSLILFLLETEETLQFNKSVLLEVVRVLESPKVQEMELARKVKTIISGSTLPTVYDEYLKVKENLTG